MAASDAQAAHDAAALGTRCTDQFLVRALVRRGARWPAGPVRIGGAGLVVEHRALSPRCSDAPACRLQPPEGIFRWATVWFEPGDDVHGAPRLVIADPLATGPLQVAGRRIPLALDTPALPRLGVFGLLGGREVGRRAGVYVLGDYDPRKPPLVRCRAAGKHPAADGRIEPGDRHRP